MEIMKLNPTGKDYLWGGTRLREEYGKQIDLTPLAETWECSVHPDGPSYVANGIYKGQTLAEVKQLEILQNIFASGEDGVQVEKELMNLIKKEIDETHPLWEYVKDKGGDIAVAGATAGIPILYGAFKAYLLSKGIMLP